MAATYEPIASTTLGSAASSVTFSGIAADWTDLVVVASIKRASGGAEIWARFNSDTGSNYSATHLYGDGTSAVSSRVSNQTNGVYVGVSGNNDFGTYIFHVMSYADTNVYKTVLSQYAQANPVSGYQSVGRLVGLWRSTSAITSVQVRDASVNFVAGSTFSLYGIKAAA